MDKACRILVNYLEKYRDNACFERMLIENAIGLLKLAGEDLTLSGVQMVIATMPMTGEELDGFVEKVNGMSAEEYPYWLARNENYCYFCIHTALTKDKTPEEEKLWEQVDDFFVRERNDFPVTVKPMWLPMLRGRLKVLTEYLDEVGMECRDTARDFMMRTDCYVRSALGLPFRVVGDGSMEEIETLAWVE